MAMSSQLEFSVNRPSDEVFNFLSCQKKIGALVYEQSFPAIYEITFLAPQSVLKSGEYITVAVSKNDNDTSIVRVLSQNQKATQIFDGGKNRKNCEIIKHFLLSVYKQVEEKSDVWRTVIK